MQQERRLIRERSRSSRRDLTPESRRLLSTAASERLLVSLTTPFPHVVLGYAATSEEIDPHPALGALSKTDSLIAYPRIAGPGDLSLHICTVSELEPGPLGILQPAAGTTVIDVDRVDLVIVPGVAFDAQGNRLGYGGGYYDRLLARMPRARRVGLCFDGQLVGEIPIESHDVAMHTIVTPTRTLRCAPR